MKKLSGSGTQVWRVILPGILGLIIFLSFKQGDAVLGIIACLMGLYLFYLIYKCREVWITSIGLSVRNFGKVELVPFKSILSVKTGWGNRGHYLFGQNRLVWVTYCDDRLRHRSLCFYTASDYTSFCKEVTEMEAIKAKMTGGRSNA